MIIMQVLILHFIKNIQIMIPWEVFKWGKKNDFSIFDFGGAGKPNIPCGVRDYKKVWGDFVNYGRFNNIHKKTYT